MVVEVREVDSVRISALKSWTLCHTLVPHCNVQSLVGTSLRPHFFWRVMKKFVRDVLSWVYIILLCCLCAFSVP